MFVVNICFSVKPHGSGTSMVRQQTKYQGYAVSDAVLSMYCPPAASSGLPPVGFGSWRFCALMEIHFERTCLTRAVVMNVRLIEKIALLLFLSHLA